jgi:hypothetical protein
MKKENGGIGIDSMEKWIPKIRRPAFSVQRSAFAVEASHA